MIDEEELPIGGGGDPPFKFAKFTPLNLEEIWGRLISDVTREELRVVIKQIGMAALPNGRVDQLRESAFRALGIARGISSDLGASTLLTLGATTEGTYMSISGYVSQHMFDDEPDSQVGAILHELIENLEEDEQFYLGNSEGLPDLVEFLFTGASRLPYFKSLHDRYLSGQIESRHVASWGEVIDVLLPERTEKEPDKVFKMLLEKRELSEGDRVGIVKQALERARQAKD